MKHDAGWITATLLTVAASFGFTSLHSKPKAEGAAAASAVIIEQAAAAQPAAKAATKPAAHQPGPCDGVQNLISHFLDVQADAIRTPGSCSDDAQAVPKDSAPLANPARLRVIIATLPDPLHTQVPLLFDRGTQAIQQAAQDSGYTYDSAWLPWKAGPGETGADSAEKRQSRLEGQPGVLLFRRSLEEQKNKWDPDHKNTAAEDKQNEAAGAVSPYAEGLIVFLVGEEATDGIHPAQFLHAAQWIASLRAQGIVGDKNIQMLGPTFSGSFPSLAEILRTPDVHAALMQGADKKIEVFSGQVTGNRDVDWFLDQLKNKEKGISDLNVQFQSFVQDDSTVLQHFYNYLIRIGLGTDRLAIISEDETAYGFSSKRKDEKIQTFYYPRDISAVRAAYQAQSLFSAPSSEASTADPTPKTLKSDLTEPERKENDAVHSYAGSQSALTQEAVLLQIVSMLKEHQIEFIMLRSSNPLDQLFLAHFLKLTYPEGRVVVLGSDLLFRREVGSAGLNGMLTLSNYPALPDLDDWTTVADPPRGTPATPIHRAFTQNGEEGTYIALRALLRAKGCELMLAPNGFMPDYCNAADQRPPDYAEPFWLTTPERPHHPVTWLTVLGSNGFWPVAALSPDDFTPDSEQTHSPSARQWAAIPLSMKVCLIAILLWAVFHAVCCCLPSITVKPEHRAYFARSGNHSRMATVSHFGVLVASSVLVVIVATIVAWGYGWMALTDAPIRSPYLYMPFPVVVWGIVAFGLLFNSWLEVQLNGPKAKHFSMRETLHRRNWRVIAREAIAAARLPLFLYTCGTLIFAVFFWWYIDLPLKPGVRTLTYIRSMNLTTGVSPVLPLILLAVGMYGWCWYSLRGLSLFGMDKPVLPSNESLRISLQKTEPGAPLKPEDKGAFLTMLSQEDASQPLEEYCEPFSRDTWTRAGTIFAGLWLGAIFIAGRAPLRSLGNQRYCDFVCVWIAISIAVLLANSWQLVHIWLRLRSLLAFLDKLPLRRTLQGMHGFTWGSIWKMGGNVLDLRYQLFYRQFEALNHLRASLQHPAADSDLAAHAADAKAWIKLIDDSQPVRKTFAAWYAQHWNQWTARDLSSLKAVQESEATIAGMLISQVLVPAWREEKLSLLVVSGESHAAALPLHPEQHIRNAEEVVCLLYLGFIQNILGRLRSLVMGMVSLFLSIALVLPSYPFDPRPVLTGAVIILFMIVGIVVFMVYSQMFRDATLSHLTDTNPGELGSDFWKKFAGFGAGPVIGLVATVFPGVSQFILSWLQPSLSAMK